jgi:23S rRNA (pseudouridine1915-N3)-methyltransferase
MRFKFVWVGKTKNKNWLGLQEDYLHRLSHFVKYDISELRDGTKDSAKDSAKDSEGKLILETLNPHSFSCLLDVEGKALSSHDLSQKIETWQNQSIKEISFIIGGADGVSNSVLERADMRFSLSKLTLTHEAARVLLIEQLYRAYTILKGFPYQK